MCSAALHGHFPIVPACRGCSGLAISHGVHWGQNCCSWRSRWPPSATASFRPSNHKKANEPSATIWSAQSPSTACRLLELLGVLEGNRDERELPLLSELGPVTVVGTKLPLHLPLSENRRLGLSSVRGVESKLLIPHGSLSSSHIGLTSAVVNDLLLLACKANKRVNKGKQNGRGEGE
jgi:hypothetical protein